MSHARVAAMPRRALAIATGIAIASYSVVDGMGARIAGNPFAYALWLETSKGCPGRRYC